MAAHVRTSHDPKYSAHYLVAADGNPEKYHELRREYIRKIRVEHLERSEPIFGVQEALEYNPEFFPKQMTFKRGNKVFDFAYNSSGEIVSQTFKDCHDRLHTVGGNQFFPVEILNKDGSPYPGKFYFFNPTTVIEAINNVLDGGRFSDGPYRKNQYYTINSREAGTPNPLAVFSGRIKGAAVWIDPCYSGKEKRTFFSEAFIREIEKHGIEGWERATDWAEL